MMNIDRALILSLFAGYTGKLLVLGASPADAAVVLVLAAAHFAYSNQIQNKKILELTQEIKKLQDTQAGQNELIADVKSTVSGMKVSAAMKVAR
jgi:hypothetical protein